MEGGGDLAPLRPFFTLSLATSAPKERKEKRRKGEGERRKEKGEGRKEKGERKKEKGERTREKEQRNKRQSDQ
jgi:hypothetical protein